MPTITKLKAYYAAACRRGGDAMRAPGLRIKALLIACVAGFTITVALLTLQIITHRQYAAHLHTLSTRALDQLAAEWLRSTSQALLSRHSDELEAALQRNDAAALQRIALSILESSYVV